MTSRPVAGWRRSMVRPFPSDEALQRETMASSVGARRSLRVANAHACRHVFAHRHLALPPRRWVCVRCGLRTRHFDLADRLAFRQPNPYMTVALKGWNTR